MQCLVYVTVANGVIRCSQSLDYGICRAKLKILFLSKRKVKQIRSFQLNAEVNGDVVRCTSSVWRHTGWWWWWPQKQGVAALTKKRVSLSLQAPCPFLGFSSQLKVILSSEPRTFERIHTAPSGSISR